MLSTYHTHNDLPSYIVAGHHFLFQMVKFGQNVQYEEAITFVLLF
jgi:hypothetical protein